MSLVIHHLLTDGIPQYFAHFQDLNFTDVFSVVMFFVSVSGCIL